MSQLKALLVSANDNQPKFRGWEDTPYCSLYLVGDAVLLFLGSYQGTGNHYIRRLDLPERYSEIAGRIFDALAAAADPGPGGTAGDPPYYVVAAGMSDDRKYHKATSMLGVSWIKKPHQAGSNVWMPGIYLKPMKRGRRTGAFDGLGNAYNRGPIPPEDHERIGREVLELFEIIRKDFDYGPPPLRMPE